MNVDLIVAYLLFLITVGFSVWYIFNVVPTFNQNYDVQVENYHEGIASIKVSGNYEIKKYIKCISLPNFFKSSGFELDGRYVKSNISYTYDGYSILKNETIRSEYNPPSIAYLFGSYVCPNILISDVKNGTQTKNQVVVEREYEEDGFLFKEEIYEWY